MQHKHTMRLWPVVFALSHCLGACEVQHGASLGETQGGSETRGARHRVVVVVTGHVSKQRHLPRFHSILEYVVDALDADNDTLVVGVVICVNSYGAEAYLNVSRGRVRNNRSVIHVSSDVIHDQYVRLDDCFRSVVQPAARDNDWQATHYVRARPDSIFVRRVPPLSSLDVDRISARARWMTFATPTRVERATSSFPPDMCRKKHLRSRVQMHAANIAICATLDDQFAIIPAVYAPSYFFLEPNYPGEPTSMDAWPDSPAFLDMNPDSRAAYETAVLRTYGARNHSRTYRNVCGTLDKGHANYSLRSKGFCCEFRLTWRLEMRLIPFAIRPFYTGIWPSHLPLLDKPSVTC